MRTTTDCVFRSFLVEHSNYSGWLELPTIKTSDLLPHKVITFSKAMRKNCSDFDSWVVFYEADKCFERLWNNPRQYISKLKRFQGVITPDFSIYRNNYVGSAQVFPLRGGDGRDRLLYQIQGSLNGQSGIFEWIYDFVEGVTHRLFIPNGRITGKPNSRGRE